MQWIDIAGADPQELWDKKGEDIHWRDIPHRVEFEFELERKALMAKARKERERARREYRDTFGTWRPPHKPEPTVLERPGAIEIYRGYEVGNERDSAEKTPRRPELEPPPWEQELALAFEA